MREVTLPGAYFSQPLPESPMDTRDILAIVAAIAIVAALAVVAPILADGDSGTPPDSGTQAIVWNTARPTPVETTVIPVETFSPAPTPWNLTPLNISFVTGTLNLTPVPTQMVPNRSMITYATINGRWSATTETFSIPYPYWQLEFTAEPTALPPDVFPRIIIQVFDAGDPNRMVGIINQDVYTETQERPWVEMFYEGNRSYYFQVTTRFIKAYTINLKVPTAYV